MKTVFIDSAERFLDKVGNKLSADEVKYGLIQGIVGQVKENPGAYGKEPPWFLCIEDDAGQLKAAACCTPPHGPILACFDNNSPETIQLLAKAVRDRDPSISGIVAEKELAEAFSACWCRNGSKVTSSMAQRIYVLESVQMPEKMPGRMRKAVLDDLSLLFSWASAFYEEALGEHAPTLQEKTVRDAIDAGRFVIWEDGGSVSMAACSRPTANGINISYVYTPKDFRGRGYASACVASLCSELLQTYRHCTLYTDLGNPTSNAIYQRIGFVPHCDSAQLHF